MHYRQVESHTPFKDIALDPKQFDLHSLRSGDATNIANPGVNDRVFKRQGRFRSGELKDNFFHEDLKSKFQFTKTLSYNTCRYLTTTKAVFLSLSGV